MPLPFIYIGIIIAWVLLAVGFSMKDYTISTLASIFIIIIGVYVLIYGIENISNVVIVALGIVHIGIGFYVMVRGSYELYKDM